MVLLAQLGKFMENIIFCQFTEFATMCVSGIPVRAVNFTERPIFLLGVIFYHLFLFLHALPLVILA